MHMPLRIGMELALGMMETIAPETPCLCVDWIYFLLMQVDFLHMW